MRPFALPFDEVPEDFAGPLARLLQALPPQPFGGSEEVIFALNFQGARYTLLRQPVEPAVAFSPREREIIDLVAQGHSNKIIADVLEISSFTVATYLRRIFSKLNVTTRAAMVAAAAVPPGRRANFAAAAGAARQAGPSGSGTATRELALLQVR